MKKSELLNGYLQSVKNKEVLATLATEKKIHLSGLSGSAASIVASCCFNESENASIFILKDKEAAAYFFNDLEQFISAYSKPYSKSVSLRKSIPISSPRVSLSVFLVSSFFVITFSNFLAMKLKVFVVLISIRNFPY